MLRRVDFGLFVGAASSAPDGRSAAADTFTPWTFSMSGLLIPGSDGFGVDLDRSVLTRRLARRRVIEC